MSSIIHIKSKQVALDENVKRLVDYLSWVLPRQPVVDRAGRAVRGARGQITYRPFRLLECDYATLVYHLNQCRMAAGMEPINTYMEEE